MGELESSHITVRLEEGRVIVDVDDLELFDFVEDHLIEGCDLCYEYLLPKRPLSQVVTMAFPTHISLDRVLTALLKLDPVEIERIFLINNSASDRFPTPSRQ